MADRSCEDDVDEPDASSKRLPSKGAYLQFYDDMSSTGQICQCWQSSSDDGSSDIVRVSDSADSMCPGLRSLQDAFIQYQKRKRRELHRAASSRSSGRHAPSNKNKVKVARPVPSADSMMALRHMFVDRAKHYFGVPYARKYWTPDDDEYHSPIFLDCCGLVRRVMRDLRADFGFRLGPWNQAYMYDTLPITRETARDMLPGDLVFISATYYNEKSKKQKHNMTHVEIWLGEGPKTIGARWQRGKVQVFDSYRFRPKSYHSEVYIFKSIDTWLRGSCRSHCPEHQWKRRSSRPFTPSRRSIFHQQVASTSPSPSVIGESKLQQDQESAGDTDSELVCVATQTESRTTMVDASTSACWDVVQEELFGTAAMEKVPVDLAASAFFIETGKRDVTRDAVGDGVVLEVPGAPCEFCAGPSESLDDVSEIDLTETCTVTERDENVHNVMIKEETETSPESTGNDDETTRWAFVTKPLPAEQNASSINDKPPKVTSSWRAVNPSNLTVSVTSPEAKQAGFSGRVCAKSKSAGSIDKRCLDVDTAKTRSLSTSSMDQLTRVVLRHHVEQNVMTSSTDGLMKMPVATPSDAGLS